MNHKVNLEVFARFDLWRRFDYQVGTLLFSFNIDLIWKLFEVHGEQLKQDNQTVMGKKSLKISNILDYFCHVSPKMSANSLDVNIPKGAEKITISKV